MYDSRRKVEDSGAEGTFLDLDIAVKERNDAMFTCCLPPYSISEDLVSSVRPHQDFT